MELVEDYCHWCESKVSRPIDYLKWLDEEGSIICVFHPANFDARTMTATGETAYHQTIEQVHDIIIEEHHRRKAMRNREPLRAVGDNAVIVAKRARSTSRRAAESVMPRTGTIRSRVHSFFVNRKEHGATDEEAQAFLGIHGNTFRPSRKSLVDDGYIVDSGTTRKNDRGHDCIVWIDKNTLLKEHLF